MRLFYVVNSTSSKMDMLEKNEEDGLTGGQIAGIIIGCLAGVVVLIAVSYFFYNKGYSAGESDKMEVSETEQHAEETQNLNHCGEPSDLEAVNDVVSVVNV